HLELKALFVILTKLYFRRKNDMVVDTWSMYFGTPRKNGALFFMDDDQGVDHIRYFSNKGSQDAILRALSATNGNIVGFKPLQEADIIDANRNAALPFVVSEVRFNKADISGNKPIAVILPGIMGSNLYLDDDRVWVDFWRFVKGDLVKLNINAPNVSARSLMGSGYRKLANYLSSNGYDVAAFAFDWRLSLTEEAKKLDDLLKFLLTKGQPIHVLAHSMGGVLFREFMMDENSQWNNLNNSPGFKALFLGAPLGGSYLIPETLAGRGGNIAKLSKLDLRHDKRDLLEVFSKCPGLYNLLPLTTEPHDFGSAAVWKTIFDNSLNIGVEPTDAILKNFISFRKKALENTDKLDYKNIIYVAGKDDATTATFEIAENGRGNNLVFKNTTEGDGSVTWESGIPKPLIKKDAVYYCNTTHGELANDEALFEAFSELLVTGQTSILRKVPPVTRGAGVLTDKPKYELEPVDARNVEAVVLGIKPKEKEVQSESILNITISNGDLRDAKYPLLIGHFYKDGILSAERVLDQNLNNTLSKNHALNLYPGPIGTYEVFLSYNTCPKGAIVVGLGEPDTLNGYGLELSVTQGVSKFILDQPQFEVANPEAFNKLYKSGIGISALIVGGGYGGLSIENSIKSIILGVKKANEGIKSLNNPAVKIIEHLEFIELYEDRSLQAFYTLKKLEADGQMNILLSTNRIKKLFNAKKRVPLDEQVDWWQRISVSIEKKKPHDIMKFSASTSSAREELRNLNCNPAIIQHFIEESSTNNHWTPKLAKTIFELLIPNDFKDAVRNQYNILWKLDKYSAAFPWELLEDTSTQSKPLCVNAGMIRQLATTDYRTQIKRSYKNNALVIGDPETNGFAHQLAGAEKEASLVKGLLAEEGYEVTHVIKGTFTEVIQALFQDEYKMIHLAGHGYFDKENPENAGMVIGENLFLTSKEINQMSQVPEFVFVNCCHLGAVSEEAEKKSQQLYKLAANIGVQLIEMGVKAVIAAGWAVDDASALLFSETFYKKMFAGMPFGEAVKTARAACYNKYKNNNTWGAYQCYGDQFYKFTNISVSKPKKPSYILPMEVEVDMNNIANKVESDRFKKEELLDELTMISTAVDRSGLRDGVTTELEARVLAALNEKEKAIEKIRELRQYEDASYSVKALESLCSLTLKAYKGTNTKTDADVKEVIKDFEMLIHIGGTCERY
ncbi:MAG TPA: CHAT domain-containing protein, partial [Chitinophagaceae bacterium]|nr:CHAT domain-containing protein [Chitinophagaceae bacterium]